MSLDIRSCPMSSFALPCSSIASACGPRLAAVIIAVVTVIPYLYCTHHSLQHALYPTPPLILSSQMIPDPVSEGMKLGLREGKQCVQGGAASQGNHQDSEGPQNPPTTIQTGDRKKGSRPHIPASELAWWEGDLRPEWVGVGSSSPSFTVSWASKRWSQTVRYCLIGGRILSSSKRKIIKVRSAIAH